MKKLENINVRLPENLKRTLEAAAAADDRPAGSLVRRFILMGLEGLTQGKQCTESRTDVLRRRQTA